MRVRSFGPVCDGNSHVLILGSMPGKASLEAAEYYAHPRNGFWRLTGEILGFAHDAPYAERTAALLRSGVALWDVIAACERAGSLDSNIVESSVVSNRIADLLAARPRITRILFNGAKAEASFARHVQSEVPASRRLECRRVPSTSPANASVAWEDKVAAWRDALVSGDGSGGAR